MTNFDDLQIDGSFIRTISFTPAKSLQLNVLRAPTNASERQITIQYALRFDRIRSCRFNFLAQPWSEIRSHSLVTPSEYLAEYEKSKDSQSELWQREAGVAHFRIVLDEGRID